MFPESSLNVPYLRWQVLGMDEQRVGLHHPDVAADLVGLRRLMFPESSLNVAYLRWQVLGMDEQRVGLHHPDVAADLVGLGRLLVRQAMCSKKAEALWVAAEQLLRRALTIREKGLAAATAAVNPLPLKKAKAVPKKVGGEDTIRVAHVGDLF
jgi:hypothetical protein